MNLQERLSGIRLLVLDFDGVLTTNKVWTFTDGSEAVECSRADGIGIERVKKLGVRVLVLTSEPEGIIDARCQKLGLQVGHAIHLSKLRILQARVAAYFGMDWEHVAYVGNDINDLECLKAVGLPIVVRNATTRLMEQITESKHTPYFDAIITKKTIPFYKTKANGGEGAVREVCDLIADAIESQHSFRDISARAQEGAALQQDYSA